MKTPISPERDSGDRDHASSMPPPMTIAAQKRRRLGSGSDHAAHPTRPSARQKLSTCVARHKGFHLGAGWKPRLPPALRITTIRTRKQRTSTIREGGIHGHRGVRKGIQSSHSEWHDAARPVNSRTSIRSTCNCRTNSEAAKTLASRSTEHPRRTASSVPWPHSGRKSVELRVPCRRHRLPGSQRPRRRDSKDHRLLLRRPASSEMPCFVLWAARASHCTHRLPAGQVSSLLRYAVPFQAPPSVAAIQAAVAVELHMQAAYLFDNVADHDKGPSDDLSPAEELALAIGLLSCGQSDICEAAFAAGRNGPGLRSLLRWAGRLRQQVLHRPVPRCAPGEAAFMPQPTKPSR